MAINRSLNLSWGGIDYKVNITMRLIDQLEGDGNLNLMQMVDQNLRGDVRFSKASMLIAMLLQSAGCVVTPDEIWDDIFGEKDERAAEVIALLWEIFAVIFPPPKKKSDVKPKRSKATRGKRSTKS